MSDFTSSFWSIYVIVLTALSILACLALLLIVAARKVKVRADNTTGHVWDEDLREMNNPMPRWWMGLFVLTVVFSVGYLAAFPGLGALSGVLGWTSVGALQAEVERVNQQTQPLFARFSAMAPQDLAGDAQAMGMAERLFLNNCAQCHGSDARGSKGFPNLTDADWLYGNTPQTIQESITRGRVGNMPPMAAAVGGSDDVRNLAHYVLSLSDSPHDSLKAALGKPKFGVCAACHGADAKGNPALGAPNLTDQVWLHGWGEETIVSMIVSGRVNTMPAQTGRLTDQQIQLLTAYVWGLSNKGLAR
jgi:cytochrome c oxidase cbb3-type subunit III